MWVRDGTRLRSIAVMVVVGGLGCLAVGLSGWEGSPRGGEMETVDPETVSDGESLRVATYNVNRGRAGDPRGVEAIRSTDADVVFLQETNEDWEASLRQAFAEDYPHREFRYCCLSGGVGVLSNYPIVESEYLEPPDGGWFPGHRVELELPEGRLQVLNVHLRPPRARTGGVVVGMVTTPSIRRREMRTYLGALDSDLPTLVVGDFNEDERDNVRRILRNRGMRCTLCRTQPDAHTWRWDVAVLGRLRRQFDHVVYDPTDFGLVSADVVEAGRSDHLPVVAELVPAFGSEG